MYQSRDEIDVTGSELAIGTIITLAFVGFMLAFFTGCASAPRGRTLPEQHLAAVSIVRACQKPNTTLTVDASGIMLGGTISWSPNTFDSIGSGVLVDGTHVLTAYHVVDALPPGCHWEITIDGGAVTVRDPLPYLVEVETIWPTRDVARLRIVKANPIKGVRKPEIRSSLDAGDEACVVSAQPRTFRRCGDVSYYSNGTDDGDQMTSGIIEPGNSGSGMYDVNGFLIGIATHYIPCINGQICGGRFTHMRREFLPTGEP